MTTSTALPPAWDTLEDALRQRRPVQFTYHGRERTVCPHALGWKNHRALLLAYQNAAHSPPATPQDPQPGWRNFFVDDIDNAVLADPPAQWQTAGNYNASHPFNTIDHLVVAITDDSHHPLR